MKCGRCGRENSIERPNVECAACSPWSRRLMCCFIGRDEEYAERRPLVEEPGKVHCGKDAEFEILAVRATGASPFVGVAGPDPYSDLTYACEDHVGALLGHQPDAVEPEWIYWKVRELHESEKGTFELVTGAAA